MNKYNVTSLPCWWQTRGKPREQTLYLDIPNHELLNIKPWKYHKSTEFAVSEKQSINSMMFTSLILIAVTLQDFPHILPPNLCNLLLCLLIHILLSLCLGNRVDLLTSSSIKLTSFPPFCGVCFKISLQFDLGKVPSCVPHDHRKTLCLTM